MNNRTITLVSTGRLLLFVCSGLAPLSWAVVPPPDGGYAGANTAEGQNALFSLTTGEFNTAVGFSSLSSNLTGTSNTAVGAGALFRNRGDQNSACGTFALATNFAGGGNSALG